MLDQQDVVCVRAHTQTDVITIQVCGDPAKLTAGIVNQPDLSPFLSVLAGADHQQPSAVVEPGGPCDLVPVWDGKRLGFAAGYRNQKDCPLGPVWSLG